MVAIPVVPQTGQQYIHDNNARMYFQALQAGRKPAQRPDIGQFWESITQTLERAYEKAHGDPDAMQRAIEALGKRNPALVDLLAPEPPLQGRTGQDTPEVDELGMRALPVSAQLPKDAAIGACPGLDEFVAYSSQAAPEAYPDAYPISGIWCFSAVAGRRVYLQLGPKKIYPNLYFAICARTTIVSKTETINVGKQLLQEAGFGHWLLPDRLSPQKLMSDMAGVMVPANFADLTSAQQERERKKLAVPGQKAWYYDEFGKLVQSITRKGSSMTDFSELLLQMYNCPSVYENSTISRGNEPIEDPFLTIIGSMTPANIRESAKRGSELWTDGFWARFGLICPPRDFIETNTWDMEPMSLPRTLITALQEWHERLGSPDCWIAPLTKENGDPTGKYQIEREAIKETACSITREAYGGYKRYREALRAMIVASTNEDLDGNYGRLPEMALRMAIVMASLSNNNRIELRHWAKAQELAELLRKNLHELYAQINAPTLPNETQAGRLEDEIIKHMKKYPKGITINTLRTSYLKKHSSKQLEELLEAMCRAGTAEMIKTSHAKKYKYRGEEQDE